MTTYEENCMIGRMRDHWLEPDDDGPETVWCDNCGKDIPLDGYNKAYRLPDQEECYCEKCFDQMVRSDDFKRDCEV